MSQWDKPQQLDGLDAAFGPRDGIRQLLPKWEEIPEEFKQGTEHTNKWIKVLGDWFFAGIELTNVVMKNGVERKWAIRHIGCIMHSFEPKHEHKIAGCAYLLSLWFETLEYKKAEKEKVTE